MSTRNPIIDSGAEISVCPRSYATQFVTSRRPCNLHIYAANGAGMSVYDEIVVKATALDNAGRRVAVSLSFVEADVKRPILSSAKIGEAGLMACTGPTWSGLAAVQDVARWLPLVKEGSCYELKVAPPDEWQPATRVLRHANVAVPGKIMIAPVTDMARHSATSATHASVPTPYIIFVDKCELKLTASSELFTWYARRHVSRCYSFVLAGYV